MDHLQPAPLTPNAVSQRSPLARGAAPTSRSEPVEARRRRGRGAVTNKSGRFEALAREAVDDGWGALEGLAPFKTHIHVEKPRSVITRNSSPDISFDRSINPYRGCEHGCVYCFARPTHAYLGLSPGLDFEIETLRQAEGAAQLLERELRGARLCAENDRYRHQHRSLSAGREAAPRDARGAGSAGARQSSGRHRDQIGAGRARRRHPGADGGQGARQGRAFRHHARSKLARAMEPRAATPAKRLETIELLAAEGIPVSVMVAPIIPASTITKSKPS